MSAKSSPRMTSLPRDRWGRTLAIGDRVATVATSLSGRPVKSGLVIDLLSAQNVRIELDDDGYPEIDAVARDWRFLASA